jgi:hypothetical protein
MNQSSIALALTLVELPNIFFQLARALGGSGNDTTIDMERLRVSLVRLEPMEDFHNDVIEDIRVRHVEVKIQRLPNNRDVSSGKGVVVASVDVAILTACDRAAVLSHFPCSFLHSDAVYVGFGGARASKRLVIP